MEAECPCGLCELSCVCEEDCDELASWFNNDNWVVYID
jgi:hypothetical protein